MFTFADIFVLSTETTNKIITIMKRFNLFLILLALVQVAWAQTKYTERLDSIISDVPGGNPSKYVFHYDEEGRLVEQLFYSKWDGEWTNGEQRLYVYDEKGRVTTVSTYSLEEKNVEPTRERVEYDDKGRISMWTLEMYDKKREEWSQFTHGGTRKYEYDAQGNVISNTYGINAPFLGGKFRPQMRSEMEYDKKGRLTIQRDYRYDMKVLDGEKQLQHTDRYTYDEQGRLTTIVMDGLDNYYNGTKHYTYDKQGRITSIVTAGGTKTPKKEERYYDPNGNLIQIALFFLFDGEWDHEVNKSFTYDLSTPVASVMGLSCPEVLSTDPFLKDKLNLTSKPLSVSENWMDHPRYHESQEVVYYYSDIEEPAPFSSSNNICLSQMDSVKRNEYLVKLAREVVLNFGPGYYRDNLNPTISDLKVFSDSSLVKRFPEAQQKLGKKYYVVTIPYDHTQEQLEWSYAAEVEIWEDDGEPKGVMFGHNLGYHFTFRPYREWVKNGIKEDEIMPYQHYTIKPEKIVFK